MKRPLLITTAILLAISGAFAQDATDAPPNPPPGGPGGGRPPPLPLLVALDVNRDGVIDATELANAVAALQTLDANGDGALTADEYLPPPPPAAPPPAAK